MASTSDTLPAPEQKNELLLNSVKKEVKQLMEEAVTRKFVHEESGSITSLCASIEMCLQDGLKKRALGLFKNSTTTALLHKVAKSFEPALHIVKMLNEVETNNENSRRSTDSIKKQSSTTIISWGSEKVSCLPRYLWIRLALFEKMLAGIIEFLVENGSKYYEKDSLIGDPVKGPILASLLVGPCALDYTKMKTADYFWTDPPADELVQRHRIHSSGKHHMRANSPKRPGLQVQVKSQNSSSSDDSLRTGPLSAKDYVESLHQNSKTTLLYGKNNVIVQPKEDVEPLAGYLSLHQGFDGLCLKWTPNQLMNGCCKEDEENIDRRPIYAKYAKRRTTDGHRRQRLLYWDYAVTVYLDEIVYLHCHQQPDRGGTIVLVGQDGVQRPPVHFPKGGHLLAFLSCLETGLLPHGQLDPPLWSQRGKGKVFPKLKRKASRLTQISQLFEEHLMISLDNNQQTQTVEEEEATDYVFRIITTFRPENIPVEIMEARMKRHLGPVSEGNISPLMSVTSIQSYARTQQHFNNTCISRVAPRSAVKQLCDTMTKQIRSRAFYGWLSHCRHLKTVRTHLSGFVNASIVSGLQPYDASTGLTQQAWAEMRNEGVVSAKEELYRLVYYGGCEHEIRQQVWPYLLEHYSADSTESERLVQDEEARQHYEATMCEWLAIEAIVRQRDREIMAASLAKLSSESQDGHIPLVRKDSNLSNDVFESVDSDDLAHPETVPEESSCATSSEMSPGPMASGELPPFDVNHDDEDVVHHSEEEQAVETVNGEMKDEEKKKDEEREDDSVCMEDNLVKVTKSSVEVMEETIDDHEDGDDDDDDDDGGEDTLSRPLAETEHLSASRESFVLPASPTSNASNGGVYSPELLDNVTINLHRIDKDVQRCDRNYAYFTPANLDKLRNIMCTYVWEHLEVGYVQGMCDLVAPLLVIFDDESKTYSCFCQLMKRMSANFPHGGAMDQHFANMRSLIQILDPELFEHMHQNGDYTHFYFCYRWFLLDFKRELLYDDVFSVWETIWAAKHISSPHFMLFIALALVEYYREIIMDNNMDFTDIIKFFNEMAERHNRKQVLQIARDLVYKLQDLIENK